jgi:hypothetical protein
VTRITWVLRGLWAALAVLLIGAILVGIIRGTFYTGPAPAPEKPPVTHPAAPAPPG